MWPSLGVDLSDRTRQLTGTSEVENALGLSRGAKRARRQYVPMTDAVL